MNSVELERKKLIWRYNELKQMTKPILSPELMKNIFNQNIEHYDIETIKNIILKTLNKIGSRVSSGVFLVILINYKDLFESNDPIKVMKLAIRTKKSI